ncbi:MAG TPA: hypothetical protein VKY89_18305 [Thermoanaerobaculia bacterium]|jgi:hypothetical protein|nr:hypothetical protein [Thermoanaerobaculia bacterium]
MKRQHRKLTLGRETLVNLDSGALHTAIGAATDTASSPCCPLTKTPGCEPTWVGCPTALCTRIHCP